MDIGEYPANLLEVAEPGLLVRIPFDELTGEMTRGVTEQLLNGYLISWPIGTAHVWGSGPRDTNKTVNMQAANSDFINVGGQGAGGFVPVGMFDDGILGMPRAQVATVGVVSMWVQPEIDDATTPQALFSISSDEATDATYLLFRFRWGTNRLYIDLKQDTVMKYQAWVDTTDFNTTDWHHVAVVHDGVAPRLYVDGKERTLNYDVNVDSTLWFKAVLTDATVKADTASICTLRATAGNWYPLFEGRVCEFRIYDRVLTAQEMLDLYDQLRMPVRSGEQVSYLGAVA